MFKSCSNLYLDPLSLNFDGFGLVHDVTQHNFIREMLLLKFNVFMIINIDPAGFYIHRYFGLNFITFSV